MPESRSRSNFRSVDLPDPKKRLDRGQLWQYAEGLARRRLSAEERKQVDPEGSYHHDLDYSVEDVHDLVPLIRKLPKRGRPSPAGTRERQAQASADQTASIIAQVVDTQRQMLFGSTGVPYPDDVEGAALWIFQQLEAQPVRRATIEVHAAGTEDYTKPLYELQNYLNACLPDAGVKPEDAHRFLEQLVKDTESPLWRLDFNGENLSFKQPLEGQLISRTVPAIQGTAMWKVKESAQRIVKATGWGEDTALLHLLTGLLPVKPPVSFRVRSQLIGGAQPRPSLVLEVNDLDHTTDDDLLDAFHRAKKRVPPMLLADPLNRRGRRNPRATRLDTFVRCRSEESWGDLLKEWNRTDPQPFASVRAMKAAHKRASRKPDAGKIQAWAFGRDGWQAVQDAGQAAEGPVAPNWITDP